MLFKRKFLFFASLPLLLLGNVMANCINLTGDYSCPDGKKFGFSQSIDSEGATTYSMVTETYTTPLVYIADGMNYGGVVTECDQNELVIHGRIMNYFSIFSLSGDTLLLHTIDRSSLDNKVVEESMLCPRN